MFTSGLDLMDHMNTMGPGAGDDSSSSNSNGGGSGELDASRRAWRLKKFLTEYQVQCFTP